MAAQQRKKAQARMNAKDKSLTTEQAKEIEDSFSKIDINGDGRISKYELMKAAALLGMNPTEKEIDKMLKTSDIDGDGFIDFQEYTVMMKENYKDINIERESMITAFKTLDKDCDGYLTVQELKVALQCYGSTITDEEIDLFMMEADKDGDGKIDYEEFVSSTLCTTIY